MTPHQRRIRLQGLVEFLRERTDEEHSPLAPFFEHLAALAGNPDVGDDQVVARLRQAWDEGAKADYYNAPMLRRADRDEQDRLTAPLEAAFQAAFDLCHEIERRAVL